MMSQCLPRTPWWGGRRTLLIPKIGAGCARPLDSPSHCRQSLRSGCGLLMG